jgi:hypothetical protein
MWQKLGGARVILATAPNAPAISALIDGLSPSGTKPGHDILDASAELTRPYPGGIDAASDHPTQRREEASSVQ